MIRIRSMCWIKNLSPPDREGKAYFKMFFLLCKSYGLLVSFLILFVFTRDKNMLYFETLNFCMYAQLLCSCLGCFPQKRGGPGTRLARFFWFFFWVWVVHSSMLPPRDDFLLCLFCAHKVFWILKCVYKCNFLVP